MSATAIVWLVFAVAWLVVLALTAPHALRAFREAKRLQRRVKAYPELPVVRALGRAREDAQRLERAIAPIDDLLARALAAIAVIRSGPFPPEVVGALGRVRDELAAFRRFRAG